jgi:predicted transposase YbfD/YdcC
MIEVFGTVRDLRKTPCNGLIVHLIRVTRSTLIRHAKDGMRGRRRETSFYVCSTDKSAEKAAEAICSHRSVENRKHYVRDVAMQKDACRIRTNPASSTEPANSP